MNSAEERYMKHYTLYGVWEREDNEPVDDYEPSDFYKPEEDIWEE